MTRQRYILSKRINRGGMAEIFLGKVVGEDGFSRLVCLKRILPHYATDKEFVEMFRDEAHICKRLSHANIVQVYSFEQIEGSYALIMEYVDGADLRTILAACEREGTRLNIPMVVYAIAMAARGLHYAHTRVDEITGKPLAIIHRDISPQNILLSYQGDIKVTDFGIADADSKNTETKPGIVKGKYAYMSPEQVGVKGVDARSDVFALCIVMWETLAMRRLFNSDNEIQTIKNVQSVKIPHKIMDLNPEVTKELQQIIEYGLQKDPNKRYDSARTFEKVLLKFLNTRYPSFSPEDLGDFLKKLLASRMVASQTEIKKILEDDSGANLPQANSQNHLSSEPEVELSLDSIDTSNLEMSIKARQAEATPVTRSPTPTSTYTRNTQPQRQFHTRNSQQSAGYTPKAGQYNASRKSSSGVLKTLFSIALIAAIAFGSYYTYDLMYGKNLHIISAPNRVEIYLNKIKLFNGKYVDTPLKLRLTPGKHELIVNRAGYYAKKYKIDGDKLQGSITQKVALNLNKKYDRSSVEITSRPANSKLRISINNGMFEEYTPFRTAGLRFNKIHSVVAYPNYPLRDDAIRCNFRATSKDALKPLQITIDTTSKPLRCIVQ